MNRFSFSAALVAATRKLSALLPRQTAVGGDDLEAVIERFKRSRDKFGHCECPYPDGDIRRALWDDLEEVVRRCRQSYNHWGHCECPYPVGDIRRAVWVAETHRIVREQLSGVVRCGSVIEGECVNELVGVAHV